MTWGIRHAVRVLRAGGVVAYPTEGVFGVGCNPFDAVAVRRVLALKRRSAGRGLILIVTDFAQISEVAEPLTDEIADRVRAVAGWPTTWLLPSRQDAPGWLTRMPGHHRGSRFRIGPRARRRFVAVRITDHPTASALCAAFGHPIVSTSANLGGRPPARSSLGLSRSIRAAVDCVVPGRVGAACGPSEIRDAASGRVLRPAPPGAR